MKYLRLFETHADYEDFTETENFILPNVSRCRVSNDVHYNPIPETRLIITYNIESDGGNVQVASIKGTSSLKNTSQTLVSSRIFNYFDLAEAEANYGEGSTPFTQDIKAVDIFDKIEWNGTEIDPADLDAAYGYIDLPTGTQVIKYTLKDSTTIPYGAFAISYTNYDGGVALAQTSSLGVLCAIIKVEIPDTVTTIESLAFAGNEYLTTIKFGTGIESIEDYTFCSCDYGDGFDGNTYEAIEEFINEEIISSYTNVFDCPSSGSGDVVA